MGNGQWEVDNTPMLMHARNDRLDLSRLKFPLFVSEKLNGWRCVVLAQSLLTKSHLEQPNRQLRGHLSDLIRLSAEGWVFDGELYSPTRSLDELGSILKSHDVPIPDDVSLHIFDGLTITEWFSNRAPRFERRLSRMAELLDRERPRRCRVVRHSLVLRQEDLLSRYHDVIESNGEGLMLRDPKAGYFHGRVKSKSRIIWKMKPETMPQITPLPAAV